jgi:hypothetical protein
MAIIAARVLIHRDLSNVDSFPSRLVTQCSLWFFSASSALNSENRTTEVTENHKETKPQRKCLRGANISTVSYTVRLPRIKFEPGSSRWPLFVGMEPGLSVSIFQNKFLSAFSGIHFTGVDVSLGVHGDRVDPMKLSRHSAIVADGAR